MNEIRPIAAVSSAHPSGPKIKLDQLGKFDRWWIWLFGRPRHSVSLDEIEKVISDSDDLTKRRMAFVIRRLSLTCGARFETARRHKKRNRTSLVSIIILSMYAIFFSMSATLGFVPPASKELFSMFSIFMASFILAFSVYESSKRYDARSENFLRCATAIQKLRDDAVTEMICTKIDAKKIQKLEHDYHRVIFEYADNHSFLDYYAHLASVGKVIGPRWALFKLLYLLNIWIMPLIAVLSPLALYLMFKIVTAYTHLNGQF